MIIHLCRILVQRFGVVASYNCGLTVHGVPESAVGDAISKPGVFRTRRSRATLALVHLVMGEGVDFCQMDKNVIVRARGILCCSVGFETRKKKSMTEHDTVEYFPVFGAYKLLPCTICICVHIGAVCIRNQKLHINPGSP